MRREISLRAWMFRLQPVELHQPERRPELGRLEIVAELLEDELES